MNKFKQTVLKTLQPMFLERRFIFDDLQTDLIVFLQKRDNFFLSIAFVDSRFHPDRFTVEYFLSLLSIHNWWSPLWSSDREFRPFERIGALLTQEERIKYFPGEQWSDKRVDFWWRAKSQEEFVSKLRDNFHIIVECADRFDTTELRRKVSASHRLAERLALVASVYDLFSSGDEVPAKLVPKLVRKLQAKEHLLRIGKCAYKLLKEKGEECNNHSVYSLSHECYNMYFRKY